MNNEQHDPLCPYSPERIGVGGIGAPVPNMPLIPAMPCECGLIARVREDERASVVQNALACFDQDDAYAAISALGGIQQ